MTIMLSHFHPIPKRHELSDGQNCYINIARRCVVGEGAASKRIYKPISCCKNNWECVGRSETISY